MSDPFTDWHEWRAQGIGGSEVAAVLGLSPWSSPYKVWAEKVGLIPRNDTSTDAQEFGRRAEPMLARWFEDHTGLYVLGEQSQRERADKPWMRCTIDGEVAETPDAYYFTDPLGVYEAKTTSEPASEWETAVPVHYACQATWNMLVTGTTHCWFAVLHLAFGRAQFRVYPFTLDPDDAALVEKKVEQFWHDHVLTGIPPAVDDHEATTDTLNAMWPDTTGTIEATPDLLQLLLEREQWKETGDIAQKNLDRCNNEIRLAIGDHEQLVASDGRKLASFKWQTAHRLDVTALRNEQPEIAAAYLTESRSRVLRVTTPKGEQ